MNAVFTQSKAIRQKTYDAYSHLFAATTCWNHVAETLGCPVTIHFKNVFGKQLKGKHKDTWGGNAHKFPCGVTSAFISMFTLCGVTSNFKPDGVTTLSHGTVVWRLSALIYVHQSSSEQPRSAIPKQGARGKKPHVGGRLIRKDRQMWLFLAISKETASE